VSLSVDGVWKAGVWDTTVWADGVWRESAAAEPEVTQARTSGVRRRWGYKYRDKIYYFEDLRALQRWANALPEEIMRPDYPGKRGKRARKNKIIVPVETIREARKAGYSNLQKLSDSLNWKQLEIVSDRLLAEQRVAAAETGAAATQALSLAAARAKEEADAALRATALMELEDERDFLDFVRSLD